MHRPHRTATSTSGTSSQLQALAARFHTLMQPLLSPGLMVKASVTIHMMYSVLKPTRDEFALVGVEGDGVDGVLAFVVALAARGTQVPQAHRAILRARVHPLAGRTMVRNSVRNNHVLTTLLPIALEADAGDVAGVPVVCHYWLWVVAGHVVHADLRVACCSEQALVKCDLETVDLVIMGVSTSSQRP